jgi:hypothetical protein
MAPKDIDELNPDEEALTEGEKELFEEGSDEPAEADIQRTQPPHEVIKLPSGEALSAEETHTIASRSRARVIMLAGAQRSGKTTLLYCLFLCFQKGIFANYSFKNSQTLMGLERRCWDARTVSMREKAETLRTEVEEHNYLHMTVRKKGIASPLDIIFCDLSGEVFERSINSTESCTDIEELPRIDHLVILIDGDKLRRTDLRHAAQQDARLLLRSFVDSKALSPVVPVEIVFTKIDLFGDPPPRDEKDELKPFYASREQTKLYLEYIKKEITREFEDKGLRLRFFETVARLESREYELGYGVDKLFPIWMDELRSPQPRLTIKQPKKALREIDMFVERELYAGH